MGVSCYEMNTMYRKRHNETYNFVSVTGRMRAGSSYIFSSLGCKPVIRCPHLADHFWSHNYLSRSYVFNVWRFHRHPLKQETYTARDLREKTRNTARVQLTLYYWIVHHFMCNTSPKKRLFYPMYYYPTHSCVSLLYIKPMLEATDARPVSTSDRSN